jgi:hypothetical protein
MHGGCRKGGPADQPAQGVLAAATRGTEPWPWSDIILKYHKKEPPRERKIFISHSSQDEKLVHAFTQMVEKGMGINSRSIFCSSIAGQGIAPGMRVLEQLWAELHGTDTAIMIITPRFYESPYCMCELGAVWGMNKAFIPIVSPPLRLSDLKGAATGTQALALDSARDMDTLRDRLTSIMPHSTTPTARWFDSRREFHDLLPLLLSQHDAARRAGELAINSGMPMPVKTLAGILDKLRRTGVTDNKIWAFVWDVDKQTQINKMFGHRIGNLVLAEIGKVLRV